ncbi:MAG: hypothetical protein EBU90_23200, partial [Proteobacteria bacterium]|nr:hypothetical protein [Pseudomonadota bacterium]
LFTALLLATSHNYGGQGPAENLPEYAPAPQQATLHPDQLRFNHFIQEQKRLSRQLNDLPTIPVDPVLQIKIGRCREAAETVKLSSFMVPAFGFPAVTALFTNQPAFLVAAGFVGALIGVPCEIARSRAAQLKLKELSGFDPNQVLRREREAVLNFPYLQELVYPYFYNNNPGGLYLMEHAFTARYLSPANPYPLLTASSEMARLSQTVRKLQERLREIIRTHGQTHEEMQRAALGQILADITRLYMNPLTQNHIVLNQSLSYGIQVTSNRQAEHHSAVIAKLAKGN